MVKGTHEERPGRVAHGQGISEEFLVNVGLRQGVPLLFIAVVDGGVEAGGGDGLEEWKPKIFYRYRCQSHP